MYHSAQKEQFSLAYVHAVASVVGLNLGSFNVDDDSVDVVLKATGMVGAVRSPHLALQLKCTKNLDGDDDHWKFSLKRKNYEDLRQDDYAVPCLLVVLEVPPATADWLVQGADDMTLHRRAYWLSLRGKAPLPEGQQSVTVSLPRENVFDVGGLQAIIEMVGEGVL